MIRTIKQFIIQNSYERVLLYGSYLTFMLLIAVAAIVDYFTDKYTPMIIEITTLSVLVPIFSYLHISQNFKYAPYSVWLGASMIYILIVASDYSYWNFYFTTLIPLMFYTLFSFKASFIQTTIHFLIVGLLMIAGYVNNPDSFLHNPIIVFSFSFSVFFVVAFGIFYHANLENSYNKLYRSNQQNKMLLQEVHHRVKNNLNVLGSIFGLQALQEEGYTKDLLLQNKLKIESISLVHEMLYTQNDFAQINFNNYVDKLSLYIMELFENKNAQVNLHSQTHLLPLDLMIKLGLMLNEMLTNSFKYSKNNEGLIIDISLESSKPNNYKLQYKDNGTEAIETKDFLQTQGIGVQLIQLSAQQIQSKLSIHYDNGLIYEVYFQTSQQEEKQ